MNQTGGSDELESQSLSERLSEWRGLVERCGRKPGRKRVHALRVVTLRIQAEVEGELRDLPCASHEAQAILDFGRRAEKLRDSLGAVRELDVWIGKLKDLRESLSESTGYVPRSTRETAQQIERLEDRLARKRDKAAEKLVAAIERRHDDLLSAASDVEKATGERAAEVDEGRASKLLKEFAGIVAEFPSLDEGNLHDFRKRIKKIRYMAEIQAADPVCDRIAVQVKKGQDAIGEWHDWQVLARTSGSGKHAKNSHAVELLSSLTSEAYETALEVCDSVMQRMADLAHETDSSSKTSRKPPARSEAAMRESAGKIA